MPACGDNVDRGCPEQISGRCKLKGIKCVGCERIYRHIRKVKKRGSKIIDKNSDREDETTPNIAIHSNSGLRKRRVKENINGLIRQRLIV